MSRLDRPVQTYLVNQPSDRTAGGAAPIRMVNGIRLDLNFLSSREDTTFDSAEVSEIC